jgi:DNA mismatch repair protein MutL
MVLDAMARIRVLDPHTVNKIAAGEVVERPASIVKELLDNALDARASRLVIDLEAGGRRLIRIADDGVGIAAEDLPLAVVRHATSKLEQIEDLLRIPSLGFRGEALAAIAAVSRLTITSREPGSDVGYRLDVVDGQTSPVRPVAAPEGTTVSAAEVFYNTPARREFLRSPAAERRAILDVVCTYALALPQLRILLRDDGRELLDLQAAATLRERVADILGRPLEQNLADVRAERDAVRVEGLASKPPYGRNNRTQQFAFVNGRPVRDRTVLYAIQHAYLRTMEPDRFPVVVLFLALPGEQVDVNVHPTKREVRFRDERLLHSVVVAALRGATGTPDLAERDRLPQPAQVLSVLRPWIEAEPETAAAAVPAAVTGLAGQASLLGEAGSSFGTPFTIGTDPGAARLGEAARRPEAGDETLYWQLHNAYVLVQIKGGLVLVDQHAAHERVLFDRAVDGLEVRNASVQRLLFPITLELSVRQFAAFEEASALLDALGFQVRPFGGRSVLVEGIPAEMHNWDEGAVLLGMLDDVAENRETRRLPLRDKVLATYACRGAIMMGKKLSQPEMRALMDALFATTRPYTCPHGRPTLFRIGLEDLGRKFQRT